MDPHGPIPKIKERSWKPAPLWQVTRTSTPRSINADQNCETVIVGAGITGLSIALSLSQTQHVVVLDAARIGEGSSGWNAGILSVDTTIDLRTVEGAFGDDEAKALIDSLIDALAQTKQSLALDGNTWQSGSSLYVAAKSRHRSHLVDEATVREKYSLPTKTLSKKDLESNWRGFSAALELGHEQGVHPVELLLAMGKTITEKGSDIFEDSPVESWEHVGDHFVVRCRNGSLVHAQNLVLCPGLKSSDITESSELSKLLVPVVGHVFVTEPSEYFADLVRNGGPVALWDTLQLYHYVRYLPDGRILVGGEETPGVVPGTVLDASDGHIQKLYQWAQDHHVHKLPAIQHCWKASLVVPADGLPLVKFRRLQNNFLVSAVTDGLPFGMLLGITVARCLRTGSAQPVHMLSNRRRLALAAKLLQALPVGDSIRGLACKAAFAVLRLWDALL